MSKLCHLWSCKKEPMTMVATVLLATFLPATALAGPTEIPGMVLWLDADEARVTKDPDNLVSAWSDAIDTAGNRKPDDVAQSDPQRRPCWVEGAINGRPALEFDGGDFLSNTASNPVTAGSARTVFLVGRLEDRSTGATVFAFRRSSSAEKTSLWGQSLCRRGSTLDVSRLHRRLARQP